ncbi:MAG: hypothetical protein ACREQN_07830 [Candidatus Binataceae bacterium]
MVRAQTIAGALAMVLALAAPVLAQHYTTDRARSDSLTAYLRSHRLPLVGAQVMKSDSGGERVMLYGFVATSFGKTDATKQARAFLKQPDTVVENRIVIRPEIVKLHPHAQANVAVAPGGETVAAPSPESAATQSFDQLFQDIQRYGIKTPPDEQNSLGSFGRP